MTTIATVGDLQDSYYITADCENKDCNQVKKLSSVWLCDTFGDDLLISELEGKLKCGECGGKNVGITVTSTRAGRSDNH